MKPAKKINKLTLGKKSITQLQATLLSLVVGGKATTTTSETYTCTTNTNNTTC